MAYPHEANELNNLELKYRALAYSLSKFPHSSWTSFLFGKLNIILPWCRSTMIEHHKERMSKQNRISDKNITGALKCREISGELGGHFCVFVCDYYRSFSSIHSFIHSFMIWTILLSLTADVDDWYFPRTINIS